MQDSTNANLFGNWKLVWACLTNPLVLAIDIANDEDVCAGWIEEHHGDWQRAKLLWPIAALKCSSLLRPIGSSHSSCYSIGGVN